MSATLHSIHLKNFKQHEDISIQFSDTLTVIRGPNWSGKSSILHAILYALGGAALVPGNAKKIPRRNAGKKDKTEVRLVLHDGDYSITIVRTPTTATVEVNDALGTQLVASSHTAVNKWVETTLLKLDMRRSVELAYSPQSETAALLTLGANELNRRIEEISDADYIERLILAAGKRVSTAQARLGGLTIDPEQEPQLVADLAEHTKNLELATAQVERVSAELEPTRMMVVNLRENIRSVERANGAIEKAAVSMQAKEEVLAEIADVQKLSEAPVGDSAQAKASVQEGEAAVQVLLAQHANHKRFAADEAALTQWFDTVGKQWEEAEVHIAPHQQAMADLINIKDRYNESWAALGQLKQEHKRLVAAAQSAVCSECGRAMDEDPDHLIELEKKVKAAKDAHDHADREIAGISQQQGILQAKVDGLAKLLPPPGYERTAGDKVAALTAAQEGVDANPVDEEALIDAQRRLEAARAALGATTLASERRTAALRKLEGLNDRLAALDKTIAEAEGMTPGDVEKLREQERAGIESASLLTDALSEAKLMAAQSAEGIKYNQMTLDTINRDKALRTSLEHTVARYGGLQKWLRESKATFLSQTWARVLGIAGDFVRSATLGFATAVERTEDGAFGVVEDGEQATIQEVSGGMRAICSTGVRIGMGAVQGQGLGFIVLDEPSSELNDEKAAAMSSALRATGKQIILVTHREGDEFSSDRVISL